jgi:hypothetical protein
LTQNAKKTHGKAKKGANQKGISAKSAWWVDEKRAWGEDKKREAA